MNSNIQNILAEQEKLNSEGKYATIDHETGQYLHDLIRGKHPKNVLEIGTSIGYSSIWIASALDTVSKLICLDKWKERIEIAKSFFEKAKLNIDLIEGDALETIPGLKSKFDVVFIDAQKSDYLNYLKLLIANKKLSKDCLIIADNTISHADKMKDFLEFANKHNAKTVNIGKGITIFKI